MHTTVTQIIITQKAIESVESIVEDFASEGTMNVVTAKRSAFVLEGYAIEILKFE